MIDRIESDTDIADDQKNERMKAEEQLKAIKKREIYFRARSEYEAAKSKRIGCQLLACAFVVGAAFLSCSLPENHLRNFSVFLFSFFAILEAFASLNSVHFEADAAIDLRHLAQATPGSGSNSTNINADRGSNIKITSTQMANYYWPPIPSDMSALVPIVLAVAVGLREIIEMGILNKFLS